MWYTYNELKEGGVLTTGYIESRDVKTALIF